jgi:hypothetical protein
VQAVDGNLDRCRVGGQRAAVELGNDNLDACGAQAIRHCAEVLGLVVQAVNENHRVEGHFRPGSW